MQGEAKYIECQPRVQYGKSSLSLVIFSLSFITGAGLLPSFLSLSNFSLSLSLSFS